MVAKTKFVPPEYLVVMTTIFNPKQWKSKTEEQAAVCRRAAVESRKDIERLAKFPDDIRPEVFAALRQKMAALMEAMAEQSDNHASFFDMASKAVVMEKP